MKGKTGTLTPVLKRLNERDTAGVAHWCDNGEVGLICYRVLILWRRRTCWMRC